MNHPTVSVIMPVYNVEKYIRRAVDAVLGQSLEDFEIILVNDGSSDSSGELCDSLAEKDSRIIVIHKPNGGVSSARNAALDTAKGKYIYFMDPDDYFSGELLAENIALAEKHSCCQVVFGFESSLCGVADDTEIKRIKYFHGMNGVYTFDEFKSIYQTHLEKVNQVVWNRIYLRETIGDVRFSQKLNTAEDAVFNMELLKKGFNKICYNNKCYYVYLCRQNSLMNKYNPRRFENELIITDMIMEVAEKWGVGENIRPFVSIKYAESVLSEYGNMSMHDCSLTQAEIVQRIKQYLATEKIAQAFRATNVSDMSGMGMKVLYFLTKNKLYLPALYYKRMITPVSIFLHRLLGMIKK